MKNGSWVVQWLYPQQKYLEQTDFQSYKKESMPLVIINNWPKFLIRLLMSTYLGIYSQHFIFFIIYEWAQ
jgi:hypothetical protein